MDYKIKLGHINVNIPGQASVELKDIEFEVNNFKLKDVTAIVKEVKNIVTEMRELEKMNHEAQKEAQEREYQHFMNAIAVREEQAPIVSVPDEFWGADYVPQDGLDTDGDLPKAQAKEPIAGPPALYMEQETAGEEIDSAKTGKVAKRNKTSRVTFGSNDKVSLPE